jgi:hypothetical protein
MKAFKKISLVYLLQIFAVVLLFGYTDSPTFSESAKNSSKGGSAVKVNKMAQIKPVPDSSLIK